MKFATPLWVSQLVTNQYNYVLLCCQLLDQEMDGEAIMSAFASTPGPDCLREVVTKVGPRMKVYRDIKQLIEVSRMLESVLAKG